jgi:hypothetical protein
MATLAAPPDALPITLFTSLFAEGRQGMAKVAPPPAVRAKSNLPGTIGVPRTGQKQAVVWRLSPARQTAAKG